MLEDILIELKRHAPFTFFGTLTGVVIILLYLYFDVSDSAFNSLFWILHPFHIFLSAVVTTSIFRIHGKGRLYPAILIGYFGSIGIGTFSDCIIPYIGEITFDFPGRHIHLGFIEKWWLVNPMAFAGIALSYWRPSSKFPHSGHVLLSTWASLSHMLMSLENGFDLLAITIVPVFLFFAVWIPCCTSDIVFPLIFTRKDYI